MMYVVSPCPPGKQLWDSIDTCRVVTDAAWGLSAGWYWQEWFPCDAKVAWSFRVVLGWSKRRDHWICVAIESGCPQGTGKLLAESAIFRRKLSPWRIQHWVVKTKIQCWCGSGRHLGSNCSIPLQSLCSSIFLHWPTTPIVRLLFKAGQTLRSQY